MSQLAPAREALSPRMARERICATQAEQQARFKVESQN